MTTNEQIIKKWIPKLQASVITDNWSSAKEILFMAVIEARADQDKISRADEIKKTAKQIFVELNQICEIEFGLGLSSVLMQNARDPHTAEKLMKMGIE